MSEVKAFIPKIYVLLPHTKPTAPIYQRVSKDQRLRLDKRPIDAAYMKQTFTNQEGKNRTARLKLNCDTIWQDEQIKPEIGIGANESFTTQERDAVKFVDEVLIAKVKIVAEYLESIPQYDKWWVKNPNGYSDVKPLYTLLDKESEAKVTNEDSKRRIRAAAKVISIEDVKEGQDLMIRLNGSFFDPPNDIVDIQNALLAFVDDADDAMLDNILKEEKDITLDEKVTVLIGKAIKLGVISFEAVPNQVSKKTGDKWVSVKEVSSEHSQTERKRYFAEFLTEKDGELLKKDLMKEVDAIEKKGK